MVDGKQILVIAFLLFLALSSFLLGVSEVKAEAAQTPFQIVEADNALKQAFATILEAEQAGANVTDLLSRLNEGETLLAQAEIAYRVGDVSGAVDKAAGVSGIASGVEADAVSAMDVALISSRNNFWSIAAISNVAGFSFVLIMLLIWVWFKR